MHGDSLILWSGQPSGHAGALVGGVVAADHMQLGARAGAGELFEEDQELAPAVTGLAGIGDLAGGYLQGSEQRW